MPILEREGQLSVPQCDAAVRQVPGSIVQAGGHDRTESPNTASSFSQNPALVRTITCEAEADAFEVGFEIGGFELGLDPDASGVNVGNNAVAYWGVADIDSAYGRLIDCGAEPRHAVKEVGGDIKVATVADPFGNVIGLIQNRHFMVKD